MYNATVEVWPGVDIDQYKRGEVRPPLPSWALSSGAVMSMLWMIGRCLARRATARPPPAKPPGSAPSAGRGAARPTAARGTRTCGRAATRSAPPLPCCLRILHSLFSLGLGHVLDRGWLSLFGCLLSSKASKHWLLESQTAVPQSVGTVANKAGRCGRYTLSGRGQSFSCELYTVGELQTQREAFNRTVNSAKAHGLSTVTYASARHPAFILRSDSQHGHVTQIVCHNNHISH